MARIATTAPNHSPTITMNHQISRSRSTIHLLALGALGAMLSGCVGYVDGPSTAGAYSQHHPGYLRGGAVVQDDYVYYPSQQVYYSSTRRQYTYQDNGSWMTRSTPPRVSVNVLRASPSVSVGFHDSPQAHHASVARQYPKQWTPGGRAAASGPSKRGKARAYNR